jgi:hypothetical protein
MFSKDREKMKLISFFHFLHGGLVISFLNEMISGLGTFNFSGKNYDWKITTILLIFFVFYVTLASLQIASSYFLLKKTQYKFSFFVAYFECIFTPIGTIIGVVTIILLSKDTIKNLYLLSKS